MSDPLKLPLKFPTWHIPYLEKHRIYELFHEIARELVIRKPDDHVLFTKQILMNAAKSRDVPRILFLPSPKINLLEIATEISKITKQVIISQETLRSCLTKDLEDVNSEVVAKCLSYLVRKEDSYLKGWIMVDVIRNEKEAKQLLQLGIIPTHTFHVIAPFHPNVDDILYCKVPPRWPENRRLLVALRKVFKTTLKEIIVGHRHKAEIIAECVDQARISKLLKPMRTRLVLLGPRGSGRKTQGELLAYHLNIIHIDFEYLLCQAWISPTELGKQLRECKNEACFHSDLLAQVVNRRILEDDCLRSGWVLTGFPYTDTDFKCLDSLDTPPNRVIFLECDLNVCRERIRYRRMNTITGSVTNIKEDPTAGEEKDLMIHPKDNIDMINAELNYYCQNYGSLRKYCGDTARIVNGDLSERAVTETITAIIQRAPPAAPPRKGLTDQDELSSSSDDSCGCPVVSSKIMDCFIKKI